MTEKEIVQALRICASHKENGCAFCPQQPFVHCQERLADETIRLIERLSAENAALREKVATPRDVIILDEDGREYIDYICPKCKKTITQARKDVRTMILATRKYHEECGQPLKWPKPGEKYGSKYRGMPLPGAPEEGDNHGTTDKAN